VLLLDVPVVKLFKTEFIHLFIILFIFKGNILTIVAIIITKELHNATNMLIFNLSLADLSISAIVDSFTVLG
jgi:hypothetical protein